MRRMLRAALFVRLFVRGCACGFNLLKQRLFSALIILLKRCLRLVLQSLDFGLIGGRNILNGRFGLGAVLLRILFGSGEILFFSGIDILRFGDDRGGVFRFRFIGLQNGFAFFSGDGRFLAFALGVFCFLAFGHVAFFALFKLAEVVAHGDADLFQGLFADAGNLFQLFGGHVGQRFDGGDAGSDQLLNDAVAQLRHLFDGSGGTAGESLHLLLDLLALLLFALDVNLPAEELGGEAHILALLADGQRELRVVHNDFELLVREVGNGDAADLGRLQRLLGKGGDLVGPLDDVDLFSAQFADDGLHAHTLHAYAGADRVHVLVAGLDGDLGALAGLAGDGADDHGGVVDDRKSTR